MRVLGKYFKMPNKTRKKAVSLHAFKKKVGCVLESISQLSSAEQSEAYGFLKNYVNYLGSQKANAQSADGDGIIPDSTSSDKDCSKVVSAKNSRKKDKKKQSSSKDPQSNCHQTDSSASQHTHKTASRPNVCTVGEDVESLEADSAEPPACAECGVKLKSRRAMLSHLDRHSSSPVSCWACHKAFNTVLALKYHQTNFCSEKKLVCLQCKVVFSCPTHYTNHMEGHKRNNCQLCQSVFTNRKNLVVHMAETHNVVMLADAAFVCNVEGCDRRFVKRSTLHRHMQIRHTTKGQQVCITCGLYVDGEKEYKAHVETHKQWTCQECSESFTRRQQYLVHMASHEESKYKCVTCSQSIPTKARALEHKREGHEVEGLGLDYACQDSAPVVACKHCGKSFSSRKACTAHIRSQHGSKAEVSSGCEASLICEHCGKQFRQPCFLAKHLKSVHNEEIFSCSFCDHKTNNEVNMRRHRALHTTQEQQYVCDQCGAAFQALSNLKDHNLFLHSQERNFTCQVCQKSFKRKTELTRHERSHSDDRMYVCHCKQSYKFIAHLRRHQEAAHKTVTASRKVQRLVPDADGKLVQKPKPVKEKKGDKEKKEAKLKLECAGKREEPALTQGAMQLLSVDNQVVALSVADLQIAEQQVDPYNIQVSYDGLSFSDTKAQLVYATAPPGSLDLPQLELVEPYDTRLINNPHGPMLMSIASNDDPPQPVMTLIAGLGENNSMYNSDAQFSGSMLESTQNCVSEVKSVENFPGHKTSQTMTEIYSSVYDSQTNICVNQPQHHELITMSFPALDPSSNLLLSSDQSWHQSVSLPQYSTC